MIDLLKTLALACVIGIGCGCLMERSVFGAKRDRITLREWWQFLTTEGEEYP